ncbi:MAG: aminotransferase class I/II-fold pyridoxal phosphate-dependent enzyme [Deltaproteobacteria bacterium]|nr:aminotransferase class I/II-fold pyridoxal phosphate-dependent enzyme [Deltaproteobacteria bacterium]
MNLFSDRISAIDTENAFKIGPYIQEVEATGKRVVRCNLGEPDFPLPLHIREAVKKALDQDLSHYCDPQGIMQLREAIAEHISQTRKIIMKPDRVVVFPGAKPPIGLCQEAYCNPGDEVIYPSPGFPIYESFTGFMGTTAVPLHLQEEKGFSFSANDLEPLLNERTKLIYINFPSNPTGGVATKKELADIASVIRKKVSRLARIYSDEVYEHILFDGAKHESIATFLPEQTIIVSGVSKSYSWTGGRIGWACFPTVEEAQVFKNLNINYFSCISAYNQMGAAHAITSPESAVEIEKMVKAFQERRDLVVQGLNAIPGITCRSPRGAFYVFPNIAGVCKQLGVLEAYDGLPADIRKKTSPATLFQMFLLFRHNVATMDRKSFGRKGSEGKHFLRLSIATGTDDLKRGLEAIGRAAKDVDGFRSFIHEGKRLY